MRWLTASERPKPNRLRVILRLPWPLPTPRLGELPGISIARCDAANDVDGADNHATGQRRHINAVAARQRGLCCRRCPPAARVNVNPAANPGGSRPVLVAFYAAQNEFGKWLADRQG